MAPLEQQEQALMAPSYPGSLLMMAAESGIAASDRAQILDLGDMKMKTILANHYP